MPSATDPRGAARAIAALLIACTVLAPAPVRAQNRTSTTGKGAVSDPSVYCQNWPGRSSRPEYRGTGRQIPFGADCTPPMRPAAPAEDACPRSIASAATMFVPTADAPSAQSGLFVGGRRVVRAADVGLQGLGQRRMEILEAMRCHRTRAFRFRDRDRLAKTIELRAKITERMEARAMGRYNTGFAGCIAPPNSWELYPEPRSTVSGARAGGDAIGYAARSRPGISAHVAIQAFRDRPGTMLECHSGMEMTILDAADETLGAARFDRLHPARAWPHFVRTRDDGRPARYALVGLGVPLLTDRDANTINVFDVLRFGWGTVGERMGRYTSVARHLAVVRYHVPRGGRNERADDPGSDLFAGPIAAADMVPGDWAYLKNVPAYERFAPSGAWAGENAIYVRERRRGDPASRAFFGFGFEADRGVRTSLITERDIRVGLRDSFARDVGNATRFRPTIDDMTWTRLGGPTIDDSDPREAGLFVR